MVLLQWNGSQYQLKNDNRELLNTRDGNLSFNGHISNLCKKTSMKIAALRSSFTRSLNKGKV